MYIQAERSSATVLARRFAVGPGRKNQISQLASRLPHTHSNSGLTQISSAGRPLSSRLHNGRLPRLQQARSAGCSHLQRRACAALRSWRSPVFFFSGRPPGADLCCWRRGCASGGPHCCGGRGDCGCDICRACIPEQGPVRI